MTLIELMIVIVILGLISGIIGVKVFQSLDEAKLQTAKTQVQSIIGALNQYKLKCNLYPTTEQGLLALIEPPGSGKTCKRYPEGGFLDGKTVPIDPWDNEYQFTSPGTNNPNGVDVWSMGPDMENGTGDDIGNWTKAEESAE